MAALSAHDARFLIVGGYAVTFHARPRFTKDLDVWVDPIPTNSERVFAALAAFGAPLAAHGVRAADFSTPGTIYQIGLPPSRIDVLTTVDGLEFGPCWDRRSVAKFGDTPVAYLSRADLIVNKKTVGRPQDLEDIRALERPE
ncbi:MAG: hypothetical protein JNK15_24170 [Planctomycetes bacterium]|nr:hypothetical protein [Planctomycetota bacterium]